jgi:hypothetical protein
MARRHWGPFARGPAAISLAVLCQCALIFNLAGLDSGSGGGDGGLGDPSRLDAASTDGALDPGDAGEGGRSTLADVSSGDGDGMAPPDGPWEAEPTDGSSGGEAPPGDAPTPDGSTDPGGDAGCKMSLARDGGQWLFTFGTSDVPGWAAMVNPGGPSALLGWTSSEGKTCPGALSMTVVFGAYDGKAANLTFTYGPGASWVGSRLHVWVKLQMAGDGGALGYQALDSVALFVLSNGSANYTFFSRTINPSLSDGDWHEIVLDLSAPEGGPTGRNGPDVVTGNVQGFGVSVWSATARPAGGPSAPPTTTLLLDDVWLE